VKHKKLSKYYDGLDRAQETFRIFSDLYVYRDELIDRAYHSETQHLVFEALGSAALHLIYNSMMQKESRWRLSFCLELTPMLALGCSGEDTVESDRTISLPVAYSFALLIHLLG
jgi:hypothetical protein